MLDLFQGMYKNNLFIALFVLTFFPMHAPLHAHTTGASSEEIVDGYLVDIGQSTETIVEGEPIRFDFGLFVNDTGEEAAFTDVWLLIQEDREVFFAGGIQKPALGPMGVTYQFPHAGTYTLSIRYQNAGEEVVSHSFPLVVRAPEGRASDDLKAAAGANRQILVPSVFILGFGLGAALAYVIHNARKA